MHLIPPLCLRKILRIPYTRHTTNETVRDVTACTPVSEVVRSHHLRFFSHLARTAPAEDHHRIIAAVLRPTADWRRLAGRPRTTWLRTVDENVQTQNFGVHTAWRPRIATSGDKSSVRQRSDRSLPRRIRRKQED